MQNSASVLREMESCASFVLVVLGGWGVWMQFTRFLRSHSPSFVFFVFFLRFVSQPCPHYPFSSSIMVQGLLNFSSLGTKFRKSTLTPGPGLMTTSSCCTNQYSWHGGTRKQAPQPFQVPTHDIVGKKNLLKYT